MDLIFSTISIDRSLNGINWNCSVCVCECDDDRKHDHNNNDDDEEEDDGDSSSSSSHNGSDNNDDDEVDNKISTATRDRASKYTRHTRHLHAVTSSRQW